MEMFLDLVRKMVKGHVGLDPHIKEVIDELEDDNLRNRMDNFRDRALTAKDNLTQFGKFTSLEDIFPDSWIPP
jgi:hypothetical protein